MDLIKAVLIGAALVALFFAITALIAILWPIAIFALLVGIIWFLIQAAKDDTPDG